MFFKKIKNTLVVLLLSLYIIPIKVFAYSNYLIPGGENIGIKINSRGVMIVGTYKVLDTYPAKDAGIKVGDIITSVNNRKILNINEMVSEIDKSKDREDIMLKVLRNNTEMNFSLKLEKGADNTYKTGLYVKDSISGIVTLTFIDPSRKIFGALGHEILEKNSGNKIDAYSGNIFKSEITGINNSSNGSPGEKNAKFYTDITYGNILENTKSGIFGE